MEEMRNVHNWHYTVKKEEANDETLILTKFSLHFFKSNISEAISKILQSKTKYECFSREWNTSKLPSPQMCTRMLSPLHFCLTKTEMTASDKFDIIISIVTEELPRLLPLCTKYLLQGLRPVCWHQMPLLSTYSNMMVVMLEKGGSLALILCHLAHWVTQST